MADSVETEPHTFIICEHIYINLYEIIIIKLHIVGILLLTLIVSE